MSQPETDIQLFAGDTGMVGRTYAVRSYGVSAPRINAAACNHIDCSLAGMLPGPR